MSTDALPPQRRGPGGNAGRGNRPGQAAGAQSRGLTPAQGAEESERRLGLPCFYAGQRVTALVGCVACQFQIMNRQGLPSCPQCGELIWAYLGGGDRPIPEGETARPVSADGGATTTVETGVQIDAQPTVQVQEGVKLDF